MSKKVIKKTIIIAFLIVNYAYSFAQIQGNSASLSNSFKQDEARATIHISVSYEKDSTGYQISCNAVEGKDAIKLRVNKYRGLEMDFYRTKTKPMYKQSLDSIETEFDIKTLFSGKYTLNVYNAEGIILKTFTIEKEF